MLRAVPLGRETNTSPFRRADKVLIAMAELTFLGAARTVTGSKN
jgi:hypothetical protein